MVKFRKENRIGSHVLQNDSENKRITAKTGFIQPFSLLLFKTDRTLCWQTKEGKTGNYLYIIADRGQAVR